MTNTIPPSCLLSVTFRVSPPVLALHGDHGGGGGCGRGDLLRGDLGQPVFFVLQAAPAAQLTRSTAGVTARQETTHTHSPEEPAGRPAAPAHHHWPNQNSQYHIERKQGHVWRGIWENTGRVSAQIRLLFYNVQLLNHIKNSHLNINVISLYLHVHTSFLYTFRNIKKRSREGNNKGMFFLSSVKQSVVSKQIFWFKSC